VWTNADTLRFMNYLSAQCRERALRGRICAISELSGSTWTKRWSDVLDGLTSDERRVVIVAVADNVLEGWQPERADIEALVDVVRGKCTTREYIERVRRDSILP
jgi:Antitoxin VbhA